MSRFTLSPRAAVILAAVVVAVALVVVVLGARGSGGAGTVSVSGAAGVSAAPTAPPTTEPGAGSGSPAPSASPAPVVVHVVGAVGRAGLVTLPGGSRVADALDAAGGAGPDADLARVNLARAVVDGERLYVPRTGETEIPATVDGGSGAGAGTGAGGSAPGAGGASAPGAGGGPGDVIDLNAADQTALETLPGIGPALAQRILAWRQEHGRFASVQDLLEVNGIGDARFAELEDRVRV
ncbi:ComEA family DNA-binding protein [Curtobacterium sp. Leaf183]|uniref:ComEA family DNA-binding protein n=1 Tax=Curtobacterium sp. Leaf183 TaxID=1736291 RepID=UPI0009EA426E|nr:ComEA family DNA-binding protein [Curtobacterium sp. Leaf183]